MLKLKISIIFLLITFFTSVSLSDINSDLKNRKNELNKLQSSISTKKAEKDKLVKEEKKVKRELDKVTKAISANEKELKSLKTKINEIIKNIIVNISLYSSKRFLYLKKSLYAFTS